MVELVFSHLLDFRSQTLAPLIIELVEKDDGARFAVVSHTTSLRLVYARSST